MVELDEKVLKNVNQSTRKTKTNEPSLNSDEDLMVPMKVSKGRKNLETKQFPSSRRVIRRKKVFGTQHRFLAQSSRLSLTNVSAHDGNRSFRSRLISQAQLRASARKVAATCKSRTFS